MSKQYTRVQELLPSVFAMKGKGCTLREIANHFGLTREQIKELKIKMRSHSFCDPNSIFHTPTYPLLPK